MLGELAGLGAASCWALGSVLFSRVRLAPAGINLFKNTLSALVLAVAVLVVRRGFAADLRVLGWFALSALIGLVIGDTCHFRCIQAVGPRRSVVLETAAPMFGAWFGWMMLGERVSAWVVAGMTVTLLGILVVLGDRSVVVGAQIGTTTRRAGLFYGLLAAVCQALGAALSKIGIRALEASAGSADSAPLEAAAIRLIVAAVIGTLLAIATGRWQVWAGEVKAGSWRTLVPASLIGTCAGVWLSMVAFQRCEVAVATTLTAMSPVFVLPLVARMLGETITRTAITGAVLAVAGVAILASR